MTILSWVMLVVPTPSFIPGCVIHEFSNATNYLYIAIFGVEFGERRLTVDMKAS